VPVIDLLSYADKSLNDHQGTVTVAVFAATLILGWITGIFSALRRKPKFNVTTLPGPTFCCTFPIGQKYGEFAIHRTAIALYLNVSNVGFAPSSISNVSVGYFWHSKWLWLTNQSVILEDFHAKIGDQIKLYPFLSQKSSVSGTQAADFLEVGRSANGVVYFEQPDSWGDCFPTSKNGLVRLKVRVRDVFNKNYYATFSIPAVSLEKARKYNRAFGKTLAELHGQPLPFDLVGGRTERSHGGPSPGK